MVGLAVCTKQSIGMTLALIIVLYKIVFIKNKSEVKEYIKIAMVRIAGILMPVLFLVIYLILTGSIKDFINYAILGISTFSNSISYSELLKNDKLEIKILSVLIPIFLMINLIIIVIRKILNKENEVTQKILTMFIYSFSIIILMYPIADEIHFLIATLISMISELYIIGLLCKKIYIKINYNKKYKTYKITTLIIWIMLLTMILTTSINNLYQYVKTEKNQELKHYKNIKIEKYLQKRINDIDNYIIKSKNKNVYMLDAEAAIVMIPLDKYNKDYDMFLIGNIGKDGEEGQIEKIKKREENTIYIIRRQEIPQNWQTPQRVIEYIRENLKLIGTIDAYEIYE